MVREIFADIAFLKLQSGLSWWLELRFYPAVLLFYAFGIGTLKTERYIELFRWLTQPVRRDQQETLPFIKRFAHWHSETHQQWKMLEGLEHHKTPLSNHLHDVNAVLSTDITMTDSDHTRLFETFEILSGRP
jgi:hypothetical protein